MSDMPPPPGNQPPPGGQPLPPPGGYQQPGGYPPPGAGGWTGPPLAQWPQRALAFLIDYFGPAVIAGFVQGFVSATLGWLLWLAALGWGIYNGYLQGETGKSYGKRQAGITLLRETDGRYIGGGAGIGRFFLHILDAIPCYLGFLWPLWDAKKQTFADKILSTVVVDEGARR